MIKLSKKKLFNFYPNPNSKINRTKTQFLEFRFKNKAGGNRSSVAGLSGKKILLKGEEKFLKPL